MIAGAEGWANIRDYAKCHHDRFKKRGVLPGGVPVDDTILQIKPDEFKTYFINWMQDIHELTRRCFQESYAIDVKTLRGSYNREDRNSTVYKVNAFATGNKMVLRQNKTDEKSNENTAIPALIELLDVIGTLVSTDATGC